MKERSEERALWSIIEIYWALGAASKAKLLKEAQDLMIRERENVEMPTIRARRPKIGR